MLRLNAGSPDLCSLMLLDCVAFDRCFNLNFLLWKVGILIFKNIVHGVYYSIGV
jgi:hypothetical protein